MFLVRVLAWAAAITVGCWVRLYAHAAAVRVHSHILPKELKGRLWLALSGLAAVLRWRQVDCECLSTSAWMQLGCMLGRDSSS